MVGIYSRRYADLGLFLIGQIAGPGLRLNGPTDPNAFCEAFCIVCVGYGVGTYGNLPHGVVFACLAYRRGKGNDLWGATAVSRRLGEYVGALYNFLAQYGACTRAVVGTEGMFNHAVGDVERDIGKWSVACNAQTARYSRSVGSVTIHLHGEYLVLQATDGQILFRQDPRASVFVIATYQFVNSGCYVGEVGGIIPALRLLDGEYGGNCVILL